MTEHERNINKHHLAASKGNSPNFIPVIPGFSPEKAKMFKKVHSPSVHEHF